MAAAGLSMALVLVGGLTMGCETTVNQAEPDIVPVAQPIPTTAAAPAAAEPIIEATPAVAPATGPLPQAGTAELVAAAGTVAAIPLETAPAPAAALPPEPPAAAPAAAMAPIQPASPPAPRPATGSIIVRNDTVDALQLELDGRSLRLLPPGGQETLRQIRTGWHELVATSAERRIAHRQSLEIVASRSTSWQIVQRYGLLQIVNRGVVPLSVTLEGRPLGRVAARSTVKFEQIPEGQRRIVVTTPEGQLLRDEAVFMAAGSLIRWELSPAPTRHAAAPRALLEVRNDSDGPTAVALEGELVGKLGPRTTERFAGLAPGWAEVTARDAHGRVVARERLELQPGVTTRWRIRSWTAELDVFNKTSRPVELSLNGRPLGLVGRWDSARFVGLEPGRHELTAKARRQPVRRQVVVLRGGEATSWIIEATPAALEIRNPGPTPATVSLDGRELGQVGRGGQRLFTGLPAGRHTIRAIRPFGLSQELITELAEGETLAWSIPLDPPARLVVENQGPEPVQLFLDGRRQALLRPQARETWTLPVGQVTLRAVAPDRREVGRADLRLVAGAEAFWPIRFTARVVEARPAPGELIVSNRTRDRLLLSRNGERFAELNPGQQTSFRLPRGRWQFTAQQDRPGGAVLSRLELSLEGRPVRWEIDAPPPHHQEGRRGQRGERGRGGSGR